MIIRALVIFGIVGWLLWCVAVMRLLSRLLIRVRVIEEAMRRCVFLPPEGVGATTDDNRSSEYDHD